MGKVTSRGWQTDASDAPQPIGIVFEGSLRKALGHVGERIGQSQNGIAETGSR
jgi:hypothetical protein